MLYDFDVYARIEIGNTTHHEHIGRYRVQGRKQARLHAAYDRPGGDFIVRLVAGLDQSDCESRFGLAVAAENGPVATGQSEVWKTENLPMFEYRIGFGVGFDARNNPLTQHVAEQAIAVSERDAAEVFGGFTWWHVNGGWVNGRGQLTGEPGITWSILAKDRSEVIDFAHRVGNRLRQQCFVLIDPNGEADIIDVIGLPVGVSDK